jgi:hypothetical protein
MMRGSHPRHALLLSVFGAAGADLNYPETVVYAEKAVLPRELIV